MSDPKIPAPSPHAFLQAGQAIVFDEVPFVISSDGFIYCRLILVTGENPETGKRKYLAAHHNAAEEWNVGYFATRFFDENINLRTLIVRSGQNYGSLDTRFVSHSEEPFVQLIRANGYLLDEPEVEFVDLDDVRFIWKSVVRFDQKEIELITLDEHRKLSSARKFKVEPDLTAFEEESPSPIQEGGHLERLLV